MHRKSLAGELASRRTSVTCAALIEVYVIGVLPILLSQAGEAKLIGCKALVSDNLTMKSGQVRLRQGHTIPEIPEHQRRCESKQPIQKCPNI